MAHSRYEYLANPVILNYISKFQLRTQWIQITVLNNKDLPIKTIQGQATGGTINLNSASSVRRTGSLTLVVNSYDETVRPFIDDLDIMNEVTNIKTLIAMNKRVQVEVGIKNTGKDYVDFDVFWIPLGTFIISNASVSYNNSGIEVSLKLNDKMALLNGEESGILNRAMTHSPVAVKKVGEDGEEKTKEEGVKIRDLIYSLVSLNGGIPKWQIIIDDIPQVIENVVRWTPQNPARNKLYLYQDSTVYPKRYVFSISPPTMAGVPYETFTKNDAIGYQQTEFTYPASEKLISAAGDTITSVLDKIVQILGNYEYFFDTDGVFHFQQIKNYLNEGSSIDNLTDAIAEKYFINTRADKVVYSFEDGALVSSYNNTPQYNQIKNDYNIWGKTAVNKNDIHYHLLLQQLPTTNKIRYCKQGQLGTLQDIVLTQQNSGDEITTQDWRIELYLQALEKSEVQQTFFDKELLTYLPALIPSINRSGINDNEIIGHYADISSCTYFLDIINTQDPDLSELQIGDFGIDSIGTRPKVVNDDKVNCIFTPQPPKILFCNEGEESDLRKLIGDRYQVYPFDNVVGADDLALGTIYNPAYEILRSQIHEYLSYNNNISLSTIPVYHLDVNQRIYVNSKEADIDGDYIIKSISIPLGINGMMQITAQKAVERI